MKNSNSPVSSTIQIPQVSKSLCVANHKLAALHHIEAAKHHNEAAKHTEDGNFDKASTSIIRANGCAIHAAEVRKMEAKRQATSRLSL